MHLNYYQNFYIMSFFINTPLLLQFTWQARALPLRVSGPTARLPCQDAVRRRRRTRERARDRSRWPQLAVVRKGIPMEPRKSTMVGIFFFCQLIYDWRGRRPARARVPLLRQPQSGAYRAVDTDAGAQVLVHPAVQVVPPLRRKDEGAGQGGEGGEEEGALGGACARVFRNSSHPGSSVHVARRKAQAGLCFRCNPRAKPHAASTYTPPRVHYRPPRGAPGACAPRGLQQSGACARSLAVSGVRSRGASAAQRTRGPL